jgi:hypothetical protein
LGGEEEINAEPQQGRRRFSQQKCVYHLVDVEYGEGI